MTTNLSNSANVCLIKIKCAVGSIALFAVVCASAKTHVLNLLVVCIECMRRMILIKT